MKKKWIYILLTGVLVVLIVMAVFNPKKTTQGLQVILTQSEKRDIVEIVTANGKIQPSLNVPISSDVSGEILILNVREGQQVQKGDLLAKINPELYQSAVNRSDAALNSAKSSLSGSRARLVQAEAQFANTKATYFRNQKLVNKGVISLVEYDASVADFQVKKADVVAAQETVNGAIYQVKSAEANLKEATDNLNRTKIYASNNGTVIGLKVEPGQRVVGTSQMAGTEMMKVADLSTLEVHVDVNENDIVRISMGDTCKVEVDAYLNQSFKGVIKEIAYSSRTSGASTSQVTDFPVKIELLKSSYASMLEEGNGVPFKPDMSATVEIMTQRADSVIAVPIESVTTRLDTNSVSKKGQATSSNEERLECVFAYEKDKVKLIPVTTGIQDNKFIEIKTGLQPNVQIVKGPYEIVSKQLKNGSKVSKIDNPSYFNN